MRDLPDESDMLEQLAKAMYERDHVGMQNVWPWDESGLDDEHPGRRKLYYRHAEVALEVMQPFTLPLAKFFGTAWGMFLGGTGLDWWDLENAIGAAGLGEYSAATQDDVDHNSDLEIGDDVLKPSAEGRAALALGRKEEGNA